MTPEQVKQMIAAAQDKKSKGSTVDNDPEFAKLVQTLRMYNNPQQGFTAQQKDTLRFQIQAYKLLLSNKPVPDTLKEKILPVDAQRVAVSVLENPSDHPEMADSFAAIPLDLKALVATKNDLVKKRIAHRIHELSQLPSTIADPELKLQAVIELKSLKLVEYQNKLRHDLALSLRKSTTLTTALDRKQFSHVKKQSLREARQTEKQERAQRSEKEKRERQKHIDFVSSIVMFGKEFITFHRTQAGKHAKLGASIARFHSNAAREEEKRIQKNAQDRLNALKSNDEEAYLKLLDKTKDTRITHLLEQTDAFLSKLTNALEVQKSSVENDNRKDADGDEEMKNLDYYESAHKIKETVAVQPSILIGGTLKDYQIKGLQWMVSLYNNRLNGILADEMGLGKTIQTLSLITYLIEQKKQPGPFLVIVPLSTMTNWVLEFEKWAPSVTKIVYKGSPNQRKDLGAQVRMGNFNVLLTTYEYIINQKDRPTLSRIKWCYLIIDEGHRMKNANSKLATTLAQFYSARYRIILTGTPLQNNLPELWALLNFILPKIFNSLKSFDEWFNSPFSNTMGQEKIALNEEEQLLIIRRLHKILRPFLLRRLKKDVESELPDKVETVIKCPMSALQTKVYEQIRDRTMNEGLQKKKALNNLVMQFRKVCNHPFVFENVEEAINPMKITDHNLWRVAGKFELLDRILPKFKVSDHRVLMFFQMTQIMDIMEDYLRWKGFKYLRLDGSTKADDRTVMLNDFNKSEDPPFIFLLSTRAGGLGLNLQTADTVIIYDSDWNPHQDLQAQDRAHRIGQKREVRILRLITSKSVEEAILARAQYKLDLDGKVIQAGKFDNKTTDREREELLRSLLGGDEEDDDDKDKDQEGEIEDGDLNEIIARNEDELALFNKIDQDRREEERLYYKKLGLAPLPRLMQENELPKIFFEERKAVNNELQISGRGGRVRKEVSYDNDGLDEDLLIESLDEGDVDGFLERKEIRKQNAQEKKERKRKINAERVEAGEDPIEESDFEDSNPIELPDPDSDVDMPKKDKKRKREEEAKIVAAPEERGVIQEVSTKLYEVIRSASASVQEGYSRLRCELFISLPSQIDYPDYYTYIKNPISLEMIESKIKNQEYKSIAELQADFHKLFANAMQYNMQGSEVYEDAVEMKKLFDNTLQTLRKKSQPKDEEESKKIKQ